MVYAAPLQKLTQLYTGAYAVNQCSVPAYAELNQSLRKVYSTLHWSLCRWQMSIMSPSPLNRGSLPHAYAGSYDKLMRPFMKMKQK